MSDLALSKVAESSTTITLGWTPPSDVQWYVFFAAGTRVANAAPVDKNGVVKNSIKFSKGAAPYEVAAMCRSASDEFSLAIGRYPSNVMISSQTAKVVS